MPDESEPANTAQIETRGTMGPGCLAAAAQPPTTVHPPLPRVSEYQDLPSQTDLAPGQGAIASSEDGTHWATLTDAEVV